MRKRLPLLLATTFVLSGCFATVPVDPDPQACPRLPPLQGEAAQALAEMELEEQPERSFTLRMERFLQGKLPEPSASASSSPPASDSTRTPEKN